MSMRTPTVARPSVAGSDRPLNPPFAPPLFRGLDGLRAISVIAVMLFHLTPGAWPGGFIGVDVFFVISGFLITSLLLRERELTGRLALGAFWKRRARRLLPALAVVVAVSGSAAWAIGGDVLVGMGRQVLGAATFSGNWLSLAAGGTYFDDTAPEILRNLWSLGIEEQFYVIWPLIMVALCLIPQRRWRILVVGAIAAASASAMAALYVPGDATRVYYGTDTHSFALTIGAVLALATAAWPYSVLGWSRASRFFTPMIALPGAVGLIVAFSVMSGDDAATYRGGLVGVAVCAALIIAGAIVPGSWIGAMLDIPPLRFIGRRSYGLYLWHWPVFALVTAALPTWPRDGLSAWALGALALAITVVAAMMSYRFVEVPIRRRGLRASMKEWFDRSRSGWRPATAATAVLALTAASIAGTAAAVVSPPAQTSAQVSIEKGAAVIEDQATRESPASAGPGAIPLDKPADAPHDGLGPLISPGTVRPGVPATGAEITAIGDSVMLASAPALQEALPGIHIDAVVSRQLREAPALLQAMADTGALRRVVVIGLGTNGPIDGATLDELRRIAGGERLLVVVSVYAPRGWTDGVNLNLTSFAQLNRDVEISHWREAIAGQLDLLSGDQIHPGPRGGGVYAVALREALQRLADLPPVPTPSSIWLR